MKSTMYLWRWCIYIILLPAMMLVPTGCSEDGITGGGPGNNPGNPPVNTARNILQIIQASDDFDTLAGLLEGTSLETLLAGSTDYTFFAPSDAAFARLPGGYLEGLSSQQKLDLLRYHLHTGEYPIINEIKREAISSLHGDPLFMEIGQPFGNLINNQAKFENVNLNAKNGLIHTIDAILLPDQMGTLADNIRKRYDYRKFYDRLESTGLVDYLNQPEFKIVLPENDIAMEYYEEVMATATPSDWLAMMQYHMLEVDFTVTGPGTRMELPTLSGEMAYLIVNEPGQFLLNGGGGSPITVVKATNGKMVFPGGIMLPDKHLGVLTVIDKRYHLFTARAAMAVAKMTGRLYNTLGNVDEKFTIFIPQDNSEGINSLPTTEQEVARIMKYHVLLEGLTADQLQHNQSYTTWHGGAMTITKSGNSLFVSGSDGTATILQSNLVGKNGVVHVIDRVLTPPAD